MLCLPLSNGEVERVFSQVTEVKSKKRNCMRTELLEAILFCKFGLSRQQTTAGMFEVPRELCSFSSRIYEEPEEQQ